MNSDFLLLLPEGTRKVQTVAEWPQEPIEVFAQPHTEEAFLHFLDRATKIPPGRSHAYLLHLSNEHLLIMDYLENLAF